MKYEDMYKKCSDKKKFIKLALKMKNIKINSAERRYYDMKKKFSKNKKVEIKKVTFPNDEKTKPSIYKMRELDDMKRFKCPIDRKFLYRFGFSKFEANWLQEEKLI